jgi:hypothetical protein
VTIDDELVVPQEFENKFRRSWKLENAQKAPKTKEASGAKHFGE